MIAIQPLDAGSVQPFALMVQPGLRQTVLEIGTDPELLVLGAFFWGHPAGVVAVYTNAATVQLLDIYVLPAYRQAGIGTSLLAAVAAAGQHAGCDKLYTLYRPDDHTPAFERLLSKAGWQPPTLSYIVFWTTHERDALHLDWVQQYRFEPPYEVVPWPDVTTADLDTIYKVLPFPCASKGNNRHTDCVDNTLDEIQIITFS